MYRRYTVHRDGDVLVEDLDPSGKPIEPEAVPPEDRLPIEVVVMADDTIDAKAHLLELLEFAYSAEADGNVDEAAVQAGFRKKPSEPVS